MLTNRILINFTGCLQTYMPRILTAILLLTTGISTAAFSFYDHHAFSTEWEKLSVTCYPGIPDRPDCPPADAINDKDIKQLHENRTWKHISELPFDPLELGIQSKAVMVMPFSCNGRLSLWKTIS